MITVKSNIMKIVLVGAVAVTQLASPAAVLAASLVVQTNADNTITDVQCSLREAITNANDDLATFPDCPSGTGNDTITFNAGMTIMLASTLPAISDADGLVIDGGGT